MMRLVAIAAVLAVAMPARDARSDDDFANATVIFARGNSLVRVDPKGHGETEIATFGDPKERGASSKEDKKKPVVRSLRSDAAGKVLLVDLDGTWQWMPLDGSAKTLSSLPCADGPAQLAEDGACVLCRAKAGSSMIVNLATGKTFPIDVPAVGTRLAGTGAERRLVWADGKGVWMSPPGAPKQAKKVAPDAPLRAFLPSPDGARALGVYSDEIYVDAHNKKPAEILMGFALDGDGARRKAIKNGVPLEWSHDGQWVLVQDGASACLMHATGGEYKCWRGYTAASISSDGKFGLVLGNRDGSKRQTPAPAPKDKPKGKDSGKTNDKPKEKKKEPEPMNDPDLMGPRPEPADEPENATTEEPAPPDVAVAPPSGPLSLYRVQLEGSPYTERPTLVAKIVDGAALWVSATAPAAP
jgi:hypothetical protein